MILYFLCFARLPYRNANALDEDFDEDLDQLRDEITSWGGLHEERQLRPDLPEKLYTFLRRLLSLDPADRPSAEDILLGIKTGSGLDDVIDSRPSSSGHMYDDLRNSSRISPVDSPISRARSPMTPQPPRRTSIGFATRSSSGLSKLRFGSHSHSSTVDETTSPPTSPGGSLVLREKFPSPTRVDGFPQLPAPQPPPSTATPETWTLVAPRRQQSLKVMLFLLKVLSMTALCSPVAANPNFAYPLFALATVDLLFQQESSMIVTLVLVLLHVATLCAGSYLGALCVPKSSVWAAF